MAATTSLREALNQGISSGNFIDTKVILYSHRDPSGRVCRPKALYANSHVLKTVPYFQDLLFGDFAESQPKDFKDEIDEGEFADDYGYLSDSDLEDDDDEKPSFDHAAESEIHSYDPLQAPAEGTIRWENYEEQIEKGKVVKIPDMAFVTFQAFLMYLYTGVIEFAPFGSVENRKSRSAEIVDPSDDKVPRPSPKSIYRLADKYDVPSLKALALDYVRDGLASRDFVEEAFGEFASRYDEVRNLYIRQLAFNWTHDSTVEEVRTSVGEKVNSFVEGDLEHATEILSGLLEIATTDGDITIPDTPLNEAKRAPSPVHWPSVRTALIGSARKGFFFDRKYWVRHSKAGGALRPVYLSNTIMKDTTQQLNKLVAYLTVGNLLGGDLEGNVDVESDCERSPPGFESESLKTKEEIEEQTRAVLTTGSFSAWKSLFFYRCTDSILFAPLKSQGLDSRSNYVALKTSGVEPPPCSPKSMYVLANLLGIPPLRERALADIKTKVSLDNVVDELFSWVTAGHKEIMEMHCDLLVPNMKNAETIALVKEKVRNISDGSSAHCAGALNLVLAKAFEFKKQGGGVKLRCGWGLCSWSRNPISYSSVGSKKYCPKCDEDYMECVGCGWERTGKFSSCKGCGKRFI